MKILHTADWHLGKQLDYISRLEEQHKVMNEICEIAENEQVDAVFIVGDLFDGPNPPIAATKLFYHTLKRLSRNGQCAVVGIAGNHDAPERIEAPTPLAEESGIILLGYPNSKVEPFELSSGIKVLKSDEGFIELQLPDYEYPLRLLLTPYANEIRLKKYLGSENTEEELRKVLQKKWHYLAEKYCDKHGVNMLLAHLFVMQKGGERYDEGDDEKSILTVGTAQEIYTENFPKQIQYVALGHLHRNQRISGVEYPVYYSSSPLSYSMSEAEQQKYVMIVNAEPAKSVECKKVPLQSGKKLVRKTFRKIEEAEDWLKSNPDTIVELTMVTPNFLNANERKVLHDSHNHILNIIPKVEKEKGEADNETPTIDISKDIEDLFIDYFRAKHQQMPSDSIIDLFRELKNIEKEE